MKPILLLAPLLLAAGCSEGGGEPDLSGPAAEVRWHTLQEEISALVGDLSCTDSQQCAFAPVGAKPCGGPSGYVVYSRPNVDEGLLLAKLAALEQLERENDFSWESSDCSVLPQPVPACKDGICVDTRD